LLGFKTEAEVSSSGSTVTLLYGPVFSFEYHFTRGEIWGLLTGRFLAEKAKKKRRNGKYNCLFPALLPGPSVVQVRPYIGDKQVKSRSSGDSLFDAGIQAEVTSAFFGSS
jgi:hypothetical protein